MNTFIYKRVIHACLHVFFQKLEALQPETLALVPPDHPLFRLFPA